MSHESFLEYLMRLFEELGIDAHLVPDREPKRKPSKESTGTRKIKE